MGVSALLQGRPTDALEHITVAVDSAPPVVYEAGPAWATAEAGHTTKAGAIISGLGGPSLSGVPRRVYTTVVTLAALADRELGRRLYDELLPSRAQFCGGQGTGWGPHRPSLRPSGRPARVHYTAP